MEESFLHPALSLGRNGRWNGSVRRFSGTVGVKGTALALSIHIHLHTALFTGTVVTSGIDAHIENPAESLSGERQERFEGNGKGCTDLEGDIQY